MRFLINLSQGFEAVSMVLVFAALIAFGKFSLRPRKLFTFLLCSALPGICLLLWLAGFRCTLGSFIDGFESAYAKVDRFAESIFSAFFGAAEEGA